MRLNHLDLAVPDVASAATFFKAVFGFSEVEIRGRTGAMAVLNCDAFELVLTRASTSDGPLYPKTFHVGFLVPTEQDVLDAFARFSATRDEPAQAPRVVRGKLMFYCHAPGGVLVEVSHRP